MVELPSDSNFAVAMKNQQQAEREEQQRIKNLVLNLDLRETEETDGDTNSNPLLPNANLIHTTHTPGHDKTSVYHLNRPEKTTKERGGQRVRRLQMNDLDWYDNTQGQNQNRPGIASTATGLAPCDASAGMPSPSIPVDTSRRSVPDRVRQHQRGRANRAQDRSQRGQR